MKPLDYKHIARLVSRAQEGDSDAFAELYAVTYQREYQFSLRYLKDEYLAQDALQETYILALKNLTKLKDPTLVISWLNQINFRVCYKLHQKQQRYAEEMIDATAALDNLESTKDGTHIASPEDTLIRIDTREYLINQILNLPFMESQVILLKYYQNMKLDEIAQLMDISRSSVKRCLKAAKEHLAHALQQESTDT